MVSAGALDGAAAAADREVVRASKVAVIGAVAGASDVGASLRALVPACAALNPSRLVGRIDFLPLEPGGQNARVGDTFRMRAAAKGRYVTVQDYEVC